MVPAEALCFYHRRLAHTLFADRIKQPGNSGMGGPIHYACCWWSAIHRARYHQTFHGWPHAGAVLHQPGRDRCLGGVAYNLRSVLWFVMRGGRIADRREAWGPIRDKWGVTSLRLALAGSVLFGALFVCYCTLTFFNGIHGWLVFHVHDFIVPPAFVMMWVFPGALIIGLGWTVIWYAGFMFLKLYQSFFHRGQKWH